MFKWAFRSVLGVVFLGALALVITIAAQDATPFSKADLDKRAAALFVYGSIEVPHNLAASDHPQRDLFDRVAAGETLSQGDSQTYRYAFQGVLAAHQRLFQTLDDNLVFATDHAMAAQNSVHGLGISGKHDLHAASALSNFVELSGNLDNLGDAGPFRRIFLANEAYKNLTDLMVHLAPAVHSVVVNQLDELPIDNGALGQSFDVFRTSLQQAGFAQINSVEYHAAIAKGVASYADLADVVQGTIIAELSPFEHKIAGRWLALQSVSPQLLLP
jgi:hypothetical protein